MSKCKSVPSLMLVKYQLLPWSQRRLLRMAHKLLATRLAVHQHTHLSYKSLQLHLKHYTKHNFTILSESVKKFSVIAQKWILDFTKHRFTDTFVSNSRDTYKGKVTGTLAFGGGWEPGRVCRRPATRRRRDLVDPSPPVVS